MTYYLVSTSWCGQIALRNMELLDNADDLKKWFESRVDPKRKFKKDLQALINHGEYYHVYEVELKVSGLDTKKAKRLGREELTKMFIEEQKQCAN